MKILISLFIVASLGLLQSCKQSKETEGKSGPVVSSEKQKIGDYEVLPGENKKIMLSDGSYFTYQFAEHPKLGPIILKIQIYNPKDQKETSYEILGEYGMPEMKGAHESGRESFQQNKKGDYLLPVNIVMQGEWEMNLTFVKDKKEIFKGTFKFSV
jgi:hypothetical protein